MAEAPYLIALALLEQDNRRAMPLQGQSLRQAIGESEDPGEVARQHVLELLLRIWQRSDNGPLQRVGGLNSLLIAEIPIEALQHDLPQLKADWLNSGDHAAALNQLRQLTGRVWTVSLERRSTLQFNRVS